MYKQLINRDKTHGRICVIDKGAKYKVLGENATLKEEARYLEAKALFRVTTENLK